MSLSANLPDSMSPRIGMLAIACLAVGMLGHALPFAVSPLVPFLSSPGFALFALLIYGWRLWPGVAAGTLAIALIGGAPVPAALAIAAGGTLEALLGVILLRKAGYRQGHDSLRDVLILGLLATALPPVTAIPLNVLGLSWIGGMEIPLQQAGLNWWVSDAFSILLTTPLLLKLAAQRRREWSAARFGEATGLLAALLLAGMLSFGIGYSYFAKPFILFPFVIWAVLRFRMTGAAAVSFVIAHLAVWGMLQGSGPFISDGAPPVWNPVTLWAFVAVITATSQIFAAMVEAHRRAQDALADSEKNTHALLNAVTEAAYLIDRHGVVLAVNQAGAARWGKTPDELIGNRLIDHMPADIRAKRQELMDQACRTGHPLRLEDQRGAEHFEISIIPITGHDGRVSRLAIHAANVTAQKRREAFNAMLQEIDHRVLLHEEQTPLLQFVCDRIVQLFDFELGWIGRKEEDGSVSIVAEAGKSADYPEMIQRSGMCWDCAPSCNAPVGIAIRQRKTIATTTDGPLYTQWHATDRGCGPCMSLTIPLLVRGEVFGVMALNSCKPHFFDDPEIKHMLEQEIAQRISVALEMAEDVHKLKLLGSALSSAANAVFITNQDGHICWANQAFERLSGYAPEEVLGKTPRILNSGKQDEVYYRKLWSTILSGKTWNNEVVERHKNGHLYTVQQTITPICNGDGNISHFISIHEDISAQKEAAAELERLAHYDLLTGLPNRTLFYTRLRETLALARRNQFKVALLFIDLNRFKQVNDTVGHHTGDLLLQEVSLRLQDAIRETDLAARLGGDEFTVILPTVKTRADAAQVAEKILSAFAEPFQIQEYRFELGVSIGITLFPDDTDQEEQLLKFADMMMYEAKRHGHSAYHFFPSLS